MQGQAVTRIAGWDTHGLPVEIEVEKELQAQREEGHRAVRRRGVQRAGAAERLQVPVGVGDSSPTGSAYWLDYEHPYITCSNEYIETVWWLLERLHERDLLYRGHRVLPYCPRCGTVLSSHELALGYEEVTTNSVYVTFPLADDPSRQLLVWTTTPWTLLSNVAVAVHPELEYGEYQVGDRRLILATARAGAAQRAGEGRARRFAELGADAHVPGARAGRAALPAAARRGAAARRPGVARGRAGRRSSPRRTARGLVHMAPAFGADDYQAGIEHGLALVRPVAADGTFVGTAWPEIEGRLVTAKETNDLIIQRLKQDGRWHLTAAVHAHLSALLALLQPADLLRPRLLVRAHLGGEGADARAERPGGLASARGGRRAVRRVAGEQRGLGALARPLLGDAAAGLGLRPRPVARGGDRQLRRARRALGQAAARRISIRTSRSSTGTPGAATCGGPMRRTPEVIDTWFDSGSMPYAQWHYPFEHEAEFEAHFPADFICEGVDQTRGWFYSLLAIATTAFDSPAYRNVIVNELVLDAEGQKMSKSRGQRGRPWDDDPASSGPTRCGSTCWRRARCGCPSGSTGATIPRWRASSSTRSGTPTSFFALYARRLDTGRAAGRRSGRCSTAGS